MENTVEQLPLQKTHPYRVYLEKVLADQKYKLSLLEKRLTIPCPYDDPYEINEHAILLFNTKGEIAIQKKSIANKQAHFDAFMKQFALDLAECQKNYESKISNAKKLAEELPAVKNFLARVNWEEIKINVEAKVKLYMDLKKMI